jgi:hypothetical protein
VFRRLLLTGQRADFLRADSHDPCTVEELKRLLQDKVIDGSSSTATIPTPV